jgi:hypothetical protein
MGFGAHRWRARALLDVRILTGTACCMITLNRGRVLKHGALAAAGAWVTQTPRSQSLSIPFPFPDTTLPFAAVLIGLQWRCPNGTNEIGPDVCSSLMLGPSACPPPVVVAIQSVCPSIHPIYHLYCMRLMGSPAPAFSPRRQRTAAVSEAATLPPYPPFILPLLLTSTLAPRVIHSNHPIQSNRFGKLSSGTQLAGCADTDLVPVAQSFCSRSFMRPSACIGGGDGVNVIGAADYF